MLIVVYLMGIGQRLLDTAYTSVTSIWLSKYVFDGDHDRLAHYGLIVIGVSHAASTVIGPFMGLMFDKCG